MKYITGMQALNIICKLDTTGDWHSQIYRWDETIFEESNKSIYKDYGIEKNRKIKYFDYPVNVANHIRACLDMLAAGDYWDLENMRKDYIGNDKYNEEIFEKILLLKDSDNWNEIDKFIEKEYFYKWIKFKEKKGIL